MNHLDPDELFRYAHGLLDDPEDALAQAHVEACVSCRAAADRLRAERGVLKEACAGPRPPQEEVTKMSALVITLPVRPAPALPSPRPGLYSAPMGLTLAASVLGALLAGALFLSPGAPPPLQEAARESDAARLRRTVRTYLSSTGEAKREAKAEILRTGRPAIRLVLEERARLDKAKFLEASDLLLTLKFQGDTSRAAMNLKRSLGRCYEGYDSLDRPKEGPRQWHPAELLDGYHMLSDLGSGDMPVLQIPLPLDLGRNPFYYELADFGFSAKGLDYAIRLGRIIVSTPDRLWPYPDTRNGAGDPRTLDTLLAGLDADKPEERDAAELKLLDLDAWAIDPLKKAAASGSAERKARLARVLAVLEKRLVPPVWGAEPRFASQKLSAAGADLRETIANLRRERGFPGEGHGGLRVDLVLLQLAESIESIRMTGPDLAVQELPSRFACADMVADTRLGVFGYHIGNALDDVSILESLVAIARFAGLDVCIKDGPKPLIWFDTAENIAKLVAEQDKAAK